MCGILGQISAKVDRQKFKNALSLVKYRGPDYSGVYQNNNLIFGHNRLSIIDLDIRSNQPFVSVCENYVIVFNGEIYNFRTVKKELVGKGYTFKTESDTEVIVHAFKEWNTQCFRRLYGMFALAIYDLNANKITIARDRVGEKPLFYLLNESEFIFSSEIKAIKSLHADLSINHESLIDYLHFGYVPGPKAIYNEIKKLDPGAFITIDYDTLKIVNEDFYYKLDLWSGITNYTIDQKIEQFDDVFKKVAKEISISDVSFGAFLSGGVDSSGVVSYLKDVHPDLNAFTISFEDKKFDETEYAKIVAKHVGVNHFIKQVKADDVFEVYDKMVDLYDEPFNDFSFIPTYYVCKAAKEYGTMVISGDGADELFCGYRRYHKIQQFEYIRKFPLLRKGIAGMANLLPDSSDLKHQIRGIGKGDSDLLFYILSMVFKTNELEGIAEKKLKDILHGYSSKSVVEESLKSTPRDSSLLQKMRYLDIKHTLTNDMLVKVDRASMINSLEVRAFYLHPLILNFASTLSDKDLASDKTSKYFLKKFFEKRLPKEILYRPKMGFTPPMYQWMNSSLKPIMNEAIEYLPKEYFNRQKIKKLIEKPLGSTLNHTLQMHSLMFLGYWMKKNKVRLGEF